MQYILLIYEDEKAYGPGKDNPAVQQIVAKHRKFSGSLGAIRVGGAGLQGTDSATTVKTISGKQSVHDGPFAETREQLGGFYLIDVPDLDAALAIAKQIPLHKDGSIEIRALLGPG
jgi:hypothetical protein